MLVVRVLLPCLGIVLCILSGVVAATSVGPLFAVGAALALAFALITHYLKLPTVPLLVLIVFSGYVLLNRNFAELQVQAGPLPVYIGEILLALSLPWAAISLWRQPMRNAPFWALLWLWLVYASGRLLAGGLEYGINAIRDFAIAYYALFVVVGYAVWPMLPRSVWTRFFVILFVALIPVEAYVVVAGPFGFPIPGSSDPTKVNRQDVMAVSLIVAATFFLLVLRRARLLVARVAMSSFALALVIPQEVRAATMGAVVLLGVFAIQRRWGVLVSLLGLPVAAFALITLTGVDIRGRNGSSSPQDWVDRQLSTVTSLVNGAAATHANNRVFYTQDIGLDTVAWRLAWWNALLDDVRSSTDKTVFGLGFGSDLTAPLGFQPDPTNPRLLRSPHNFLLTLLARTGVVGLALWLAAIAWWLFVVFIQLRRANREHLHSDVDYVLWLTAYPVAIIVAAVFGVVLEGPYGAIPCYLLIGMSLRAAEGLTEQSVRAPAGVRAQGIRWTPRVPDALPGLAAQAGR